MSEHYIKGWYDLKPEELLEAAQNFSASNIEGMSPHTLISRLSNLGEEGRLEEEDVLAVIAHLQSFLD